MSGEQNLQNVLDEIGRNGKAFCYTKGISMQPMLKEGRDISVLAPVPAELKCGDVVMFLREASGELVLHRIVRKDGDRFIIRGDNMFYDEPVKKDDIKALLVGFFRKGKYTDCKKAGTYRLYVFFQLRLYFLRKFFGRTLRVAAANTKNKVLRKFNSSTSDI